MSLRVSVVSIVSEPLPRDLALVVGEQQFKLRSEDHGLDREVQPLALPQRSEFAAASHIAATSKAI
jgi:hypothetical protein